MEDESLIPQHGGYRQLKSFQVAQLVYDLTVRFCDRFVPKLSRTHDQMVQAARSGVQNIAEGSQASATSKKTELKLTNVARASLEELRLDYEDSYASATSHSGPAKMPAARVWWIAGVPQLMMWRVGRRMSAVDAVDRVDRVDAVRPLRRQITRKSRQMGL